MRPQDLIKHKPYIVAYLGLAFFFAILVNFIPTNAITGSAALHIETVVALSDEESASAGPIRLTIPTIDVDTSIVALGLTSDGAMDIPKSISEVAWYNLGPRPGENGSAVVAGHYGWNNSVPAVFNNVVKYPKI